MRLVLFSILIVFTLSGSGWAQQVSAPEPATLPGAAAQTHLQTSAQAKSPGGVHLANSETGQTTSLPDKSPKDKKHPANTKILVLGDSISAAYGLAETDGWVHLLEKELENLYPGTTVVNASISGETTGGGLQRLPDAIAKFDPDIVIVELGGNDALRGQSLKTMRQNLTDIVEISQDHGAKSLILGMRIPTNYGAIYTERFFKSFQTVAESTGSGLVPFLLAPIATDRSLFQADGIHPSKEAQPIMMELVLTELSTLLE